MNTTEKKRRHVPNQSLYFVDARFCRNACFWRRQAAEPPQHERSHAKPPFPPKNVSYSARRDFECDLFGRQKLSVEAFGFRTCGRHPVIKSRKRHRMGLPFVHGIQFRRLLFSMSSLTVYSQFAYETILITAHAFDSVVGPTATQYYNILRRDTLADQ